MKSKASKILDVMVEYSIYGLLFFVSFSIAGVNVFAGLAVVFFLIKKILSPDFSVFKTHRVFFLLLLVLFGFMALSLLNSGPLLVKSLKALFIKWGRFPLILWVVLDTFRDTRRVIRAVYVLLASAVLICLSVFSQKLFGVEFLCHRPMSGGIVVTGPFKNQNGLAGYLACMVPIMLSFALWTWEKLKVKVGFILMTSMLIFSSFLTFCRGGWLGLMFGVIFVGSLISYKRLTKKAFWTLSLFIYFLVVPVVTASLFFFNNTPIGTNSNGERFIILRGAWRMIVEHPFLGKGLGTFMDYCAAYTNNFGTYYAHNCFVQIWAESGIFALLSFLFLIGYVFHRILKTVVKVPASLDSLALIGLSAGLVGFLTHSFFDSHLYILQLSFLFWLVLGLTVALSSALDKKQPLEQLPD